MAKFIYTAQDKQEYSIDLPAKTGHTTRVQLFISKLNLQDDVQASYNRRGTLIETEGDHMIYDVNGIHSVFIFCKPPKQRRDVLDSIAITAGDSLILTKPKAPEESRLTIHGFLIHRSHREWLVLDESRAMPTINQVPFPLLKIIQDGMALGIGTLTLTFHENETEVVTKEIEVTIQHSLCPFCQGSFVKNELIIRCPSCGTIHHQECWDAYGERCSGPTGCMYRIKAENRLEVETLAV